MRNAIVLSLALLTGCATMHHGSYERVSVDSEPAGAWVGIDCGKAAHHAPTRTPTVVTIPRIAEHCQLLVTREGYREETVALHRLTSHSVYSNFNGVGVGLGILGESSDGIDALIGLGTTLGSAVFGGLGLAVDHASGAMYEHQPKDVFVRLQPDDRTDDAQQSNR